MLTEELLPDSGMSPSLSAEDIMDSVCYFWRPEASNESKSNEMDFSSDFESRERHSQIKPK